MSLQNVIAILDSHAGAITAVATTVLAGITYCYLRAARKQNSIAVIPFPILRLRPELWQTKQEMKKDF